MNSQALFGQAATARRRYLACPVRAGGVTRPAGALLGIICFYQRGLEVIPEPGGQAGSGADDTAGPGHRGDRQ